MELSFAKLNVIYQKFPANFKNGRICPYDMDDLFAAKVNSGITQERNRTWPSFYVPNLGINFN